MDLEGKLGTNEKTQEGDKETWRSALELNGKKVLPGKLHRHGQ